VSRDDDRSEVYAAELSAVGGTTLEQQVSLSELQNGIAGSFPDPTLVTTAKDEGNGCR